jgi:transposase
MNMSINKKIFIGIDVHKKNYFVTAVVDNNVIKRDTIPGDPNYLVAYLKKNFKNEDCYSAYEAGFSGFGLHYCLMSNGINNIVVHPASIEIASRERVKTDKRDSKKIAIQLASGRLKSVFVPDKQREDFRLITRLKETLVNDRAKKAIQLKSLLFYLGKTKFDDNSKISNRQIEKILLLEFTPEQYFAVKNFCDEWLHLTKKIQKINIELAKQARQDKSLESFYRSAPGIGPTSARILANEIGDMKQFANERKLFSYTGLTPREHSSGEHIRLGHISRQGKPVLRKILVQAAWKSVKVDKNLNDVFLRIKLKAGPKRAIVGIARRLIGRIRSCIKNNKLYEIKEN